MTRGTRAPLATQRRDRHVHSDPSSASFSRRIIGVERAERETKVRNHVGRLVAACAAIGTEQPLAQPEYYSRTLHIGDRSSSAPPNGGRRSLVAPPSPRQSPASNVAASSNSLITCRLHFADASGWCVPSQKRQLGPFCPPCSSRLGSCGCGMLVGRPNSAALTPGVPDILRGTAICEDLKVTLLPNRAGLSARRASVSGSRPRLAKCSGRTAEGREDTNLQVRCFVEDDNGGGRYTGSRRSLGVVDMEGLQRAGLVSKSLQSLMSEPGGPGGPGGPGRRGECSFSRICSPRSSWLARLEKQGCQRGLIFGPLRVAARQVEVGEVAAAVGAMTMRASPSSGASPRRSSKGLAGSVAASFTEHVALPSVRFGLPSPTSGRTCIHATSLGPSVPALRARGLTRPHFCLFPGG